jgi:hypothetical protein
MIRWLLSFFRRHREQPSLEFWLQREARRIGDQN